MTTDMSEDYEKFDEISPFIVNIDPSIQLNDEDFPWLRRKGTHAKKKFHTQRSGMWSASLSSLSSVFHTQKGISVIVRVVNYVFWHLKREEILCAYKFFHAFTDFQIIQNLNYSNLKTTGTNRKFVPKEAVSASGQAMAPPSPFSAGSYHEPVLMRLWQAVFSPTSLP